MSQVLARRGDWQARLATMVDTYRARPYCLGVSDCLRFTCDCIEAVTGESTWHLFAGKYASRAESLRLLRTWGGTWREAFSAFFGAEPIASVLARAGDVLTFDDGREKHLAVCVGAAAAVYEAHGLAFVPLTDARLREAWRVG